MRSVWSITSETYQYSYWSCPRVAELLRRSAHDAFTLKYMSSTEIQTRYDWSSVSFLLRLFDHIDCGYAIDYSIGRVLILLKTFSEPETEEKTKGSTWDQAADWLKTSLGFISKEDFNDKMLNSIFSDWTVYLPESSESVILIIIILTESEHNESSSSHVGSAAVQARLGEARLWCDTLGQQTVLVTQRWDAELYKNPFKCFSDEWKSVLCL